MASGFEEILVIDDGSKDNTPELLQKYKKNIQQVRHPINLWGGAALETGFEYVRRNASKYGWKYVVTFDADGQMNIGDMSVFIWAFEKDPSLDVVIWSRILEWSIVEKMPFWRRIIVLSGGRLFTRLISWDTPSDPHNWYRMLKTSALDRIHLTMDGFEYSSELVDEIAVQKLKWKDVPVHIKYDAYTLGKWQRASNAINIAIRMIVKKFF
jgi:polyprenyl-phospho-N-acetylgalactosaminyl synthase